MKTYFISGIGTDIGKSYVTALLIKALEQAGVTASSFKLVQTGASSQAISPDIHLHRTISGQSLDELDADAVGESFSFPASPHLAAALENTIIDTNKLWHAWQTYVQKRQRDIIFCEGAGGIFVPLTSQTLTIDWIIQHPMPLILICNAMLGSIHHSIATLEALAARSYLPFLIIYNPYPNDEPIITDDSAHFLKQYCQTHFPNTYFFHLDDLHDITALLRNNE
ncbi:dethiobiotin synthase [Basilea psittacipulmonis]|uniref:ATP-dependent dethiobiotin synthetase BioD n=1 Tax=Basilea psittacipulmonis DSM 24701 TaxID=1072685 RepID=A0A077DDA8_9BURK|nr:dethiobiotin synthase [Basilea psittacipulmonis]AIL32151.1 hypothetical protein IX83_01375 [Basilea psittacipulmonis DSM 24701]